MTRAPIGKLLGLVSVGVAALWWLAPPIATFAQVKDRRTDDAQTDIALLKRVVAEQGRRIAALEKTVAALKAAAAEPAVPPVTAAKIARPGPAWQTPFAWGRLKEGMSRAQVVEILGPPTSVDSVLDYQTLNYKGDPSGPAFSGSVKLTSDRVSEINPPAF